MKDKYNKDVELNCPTCGGTQFETLSTTADDKVLRCSGCQRVLTGQELRDGNEENILARRDELVEEVKSDLLKDLRKAFKGFK